MPFGFVVSKNNQILSFLKVVLNLKAGCRISAMSTGSIMEFQSWTELI